MNFLDDKEITIIHNEKTVTMIKNVIELLPVSRQQATLIKRVLPRNIRLVYKRSAKNFLEENVLSILTRLPELNLIVGLIDAKR